MNFIALVGTNARFSYNRKLLWFMKKHFGTQANIEIHEISNLPLFSEDASEVPAGVRDLIEAIEASDGVIISTPEYDHSISAALKSAIEWLSWGKLHPLTHRPTMIVGVSLGNMGTVFAQEHLRQILASPGLNAFVLPGNQFLLGQASSAFDQIGDLIEGRTISWLEHCFAAFVSYVETVQPISSQSRLSKTLSSPESALDPRSVWDEEAFGLSDADTGASEDDELDSDLEARQLEIESALAQALDKIEAGEDLE